MPASARGWTAFYCKWCYADCEYMYHDMDDLIEVCVNNVTSDDFPPEQSRAYMRNLLPKLEKLNTLVGGYFNMEYPLPNGNKAKFLEDGPTYPGNQPESELEKGWYFGIAANTDFILVCTYEENVENPELVVYKKRYPHS